MKMRIIWIYLLLGLLSVVSSIDPPAGVPRSLEQFREKHPYWPQPSKSNWRRKVYIRASKNETDDVSAEFLRGLHRANRGGTLHLLKGKTYMIGKPLDLTFLNNVHVRLDGEIKFTNDTSYWQANSYVYPFFITNMFWKWGGKNIKIYGNGTLNGNGQRWWREFKGKAFEDYTRPVLFFAQNTTNLEIEGIHFKDSPNWNIFLVGCNTYTPCKGRAVQRLICAASAKDISVKDVVITAITNDTNYPPRNTDFLDTLNVDGLSVERVWVEAGDDCLSPKANSSNIYVNTMYCDGTHGISMGSLGAQAGEYNYIKNVHVENVWVLNDYYTARIKTWAGPGKGYGFINNVTYKNFWSANNGYATVFDSCYYNIKPDVCAQYPSRINVTNVLFDNFTGSTSGEFGQVTATLACSTSPDAVCKNIRLTNYNVTSPCGGPAVILCDGFKGGIGSPCVSKASPEGIAALANNCTAPHGTLPHRPW